MSAVPASRLLQMGVLGYLLLFSFISFTSSVRVDFTEHWNKAAKIKVNPRGNLWATGHFMGKKSISGPSHLESPEDAAISSVPMAFSPSLRAILEDMKELLTRELLKILLQERILDENQGKHDLADQWGHTSLWQLENKNPSEVLATPARGLSPSVTALRCHITEEEGRGPSYTHGTGILHVGCQSPTPDT
ncbi:PREDICTED: neuromedin-B isoform X1 [Crocodylus porosus]|uniref:neuromedin-B isoform X1 n=1 Tax=Crocodylus porosus TaxID=8502 RepID=UPI00093CA98E|nr:PREDICTED: neuromedin-B isoform X1 [Crocodylus porosus]